MTDTTPVTEDGCAEEGLVSVEFHHPDQRPADPDQPGDELNGLPDAGRGLRVLGAAGVTRSVVALTSPSEVDSLLTQIRDQGRALPPDALGITPSIRYHAQRIAELKRTLASLNQPSR